MYAPCQGASVLEVDAADDSLGFTAADVLAVFPAYNMVVWDSLTLGQEQAGLALVHTRTTEAPSIVDYRELPGCEEGVGLAIPVHLEITLDDGLVRAAGPATVWAKSPELVDISTAADWEVEAELAGSYADEFDAWYAEQQADWPQSRNWSVEELAVLPYGSWDELQIDIETVVDSTDFTRVSALWRGSVLAAE